jgi:hypothetical protein
MHLSAHLGPQPLQAQHSRQLRLALAVQGSRQVFSAQQRRRPLVHYVPQQLRVQLSLQLAQQQTAMRLLLQLPHLQQQHCSQALQGLQPPSPQEPHRRQERWAQPWLASTQQQQQQLNGPHRRLRRLTRLRTQVARASAQQQRQGCYRLVLVLMLMLVLMTGWSMTRCASAGLLQPEDTTTKQLSATTLPDILA